MQITQAAPRYIEIDRGPDTPPRRVKVISCCGKDLALFSGWANECPHCETEYNGGGQRLAPREFWGEETGERF